MSQSYNQFDFVFSNLTILIKNIKRNNFNNFTELQFIYGHQSVEIYSLGPNLWISHDWAGLLPLLGLALLQTEILLSFISCPGGWSQTIPQVKKPDVEILGWCG